MVAARKDFIVEKGARWYKEIQLVNDANEPISLVGKKIRCIIKSSTATETITLYLTEDNGKVQVLNDANGNVALYLTAEETASVEEDFGIYRLIQIDENYPDEEIERLLEGNIEYRK